MSIPKKLQHNWCFDLRLTQSSVEETRVYLCSQCGAWASSQGLTSMPEVICTARDRRKNNRRKDGDRRKCVTLTYVKT
jgi:hypothetical protein